MAITAAAAKAPVEAPEAAPKKKSKLLPIIALTLVLLIAAGAGAWWFLGQSSGDEEEEPEVASRPSIFLPLEQFTVNLQPEEGQQFLQAAMTLKVSEQDVADAIKAQMPEVRSRVLFLLSSKKPSQLATLEGKNRLIEELMQEVEAALPPVKGKAKKAKKRASDDDEPKSGKKGKNKAKAKANASKDTEAEVPAPRRVVAVFFTHFIVQ